MSNKRIHPKLARGIRKLKLMRTLRSDPQKIRQEGKSFYCVKCGYKFGSQKCESFTLPDPKIKDFQTHKIVFEYRNDDKFRFVIYNCWIPK